MITALDPLIPEGIRTLIKFRSPDRDRVEKSRKKITKVHLSASISPSLTKTPFLTFGKMKKPSGSLGFS